MKVCFIDKTEFQYNCNDINKPFIRGAENVLINLSLSINKLGHKVVVFNNCAREYNFKNYSWLNIKKINPKNFNFDIAISNNDTKLLDYVSSTKKYVLSHSLQSIEKFIRKNQLKSYLKNKPTYLLLGDYHKSKMSKLFSIYGTMIIDYGLDEIFTNISIEDNVDNNLGMFTSRTDRNLDMLLDIWKSNIFPKKKDLKLYISPINENLENFRIFNREYVEKNEYINQINKSRVIILPGHKAELYCLAASEAQELCIPVVTMGIGSLSERVEHNVTGLIAKNKDQFSDYIIDIFSNDNLWLTFRKNLLSKRGEKTWHNASKKFLEKVTNNV